MRGSSMGMGRRVVVAVLLGALSVALGTAPALASPREPTGDRIGLFGGDQEYPADTPFFISHGNGMVVGEDRALGRDGFVLEVDGMVVDPSYETRSLADGMFVHARTYDFPDGMTGTHMFTGHWLAPCGAPTAYLPCGDARPNTPVEYQSLTITVMFTAP